MLNEIVGRRWATWSKRRVLLVFDGQAVVSEALRALIDRETDLAVSDIVKAEAVPDALRGTSAEAVLLDVSAPDNDGADLVRAVRVWNQDVPVLLLSTFDVPSRASRAMAARADAYVSRHDAPETLLHALRRALTGARFVSDQLHDTLLTRRDALAAMLTPRELEVFSGLGVGMGTREIAEDLGLSIKTIESHQAKLKKKVKVRNGRELVKCAIEWKSRQ